MRIASPVLRPLVAVVATSCAVWAGCLPSDVIIGEVRDTAPTVGCVEDCDRARVHTQTSRVDLLLVIDNSGSMAEERDRLAGGFEDLLERAVGEHHDLHLGLLVAELDDPAHGGRLVRVGDDAWTDATDASDAAAWLATALDAVGVNESNEEQARAVVHAALTTFGDGVNAGFRRDDAHLALLLLTDEDDATVVPSIAAFVDWLDARWGLPAVTAHAIIGQAEDAASGCAGAYGREHLQLVEATGGTHLSVCEVDYGPFLTALGQVVVQEGLSSRFELGEPAVPESIAVEVRYPTGFVDALDPEDLGYNDGAVILAAPPPAGSAVEITWRLP